MNKVVRLVNLWAEFEEENPDGELENFCVHYLEKQLLLKDTTLEKSAVSLNAKLASLTGKLSRYASHYSKMALSGLPLNNVEDWVYLMQLVIMGEPTKSELIYEMISEFPSGIDVIKRLIKNKLVTEFPDANDKRSKRLRITPEGIQFIQMSLPKMEQVGEMAFDKLKESEKYVLIGILEKLAQFHKQHFKNVKNTTMDEAYQLLTSRVRTS